MDPTKSPGYILDDVTLLGGSGSAETDGAEPDPTPPTDTGKPTPTDAPSTPAQDPTTTG
uniref:Sigma-like protein n=1 Tax=Streptomyces sp. NBC_00008 TaxID=2903610 RepID=A0AAU2VQS7_9ACTN